MHDPRWEDIKERAVAEGLETWPTSCKNDGHGLRKV